MGFRCSLYGTTFVISMLKSKSNHLSIDFFSFALEHSNVSAKVIITSVQWCSG